MPLPTTPYSLSGGQSQTDFFWVGLKGDKSGYDIYDPTILTTPTPLAVPTRANACAYSIQMLADTKPAPQADGSMKVDYDNYEDSEELNTYLLNPFAVPAASVAGALPEWKNEKGVQFSGASQAKQMLVGVIYGALTPTDKHKVTAPFGRLEYTSGAHGQKADDYSKVSISFQGEKTEADLVIPSACLDATIVTPQSITIAKGKGFYRDFIAKA